MTLEFPFFTMCPMDLLQSLQLYLPKEEVNALKDALFLPPVHGLVLNTSKLSEKDLLALYPNLKKMDDHPLGYRYDANEYPLGKSLPFDLGAFYITDPSASLVSSFLSPVKNARVLDMCAAPGGKSIGLSLLRPDVTILSNDISYPRAKELSGNVERMGLSNIAVTCADFSSYYHKFNEYFDAIILDAPCSGSAMFRKNQMAQDLWSVDKVNKCAAIQTNLLEMAYSMLKKGGRIIYSTCSFSKEEDLDQINGLLLKHQDMKMLQLPDNPGYFRHPDLPEAIFLFPHRYQGEGQFIALLEKEGSLSLVQSRNNPAPKRLPIDISPYGLDGFDFLGKDGSLYAINNHLDINGLPLLRYGVKVGEDVKPDFALARSLSAEKCLPLDKKTAHDYLYGLTFPSKEKDGYYPVAYNGMSLGFIKVSQGTAKNHYPKGLRHDYRELL